MHIEPFLLLVLIISLAQGCSFSKGSKSSADSSTTSSESTASFISSPSSSSSKDEEKYQHEVMNYTSVYITSTVFDHFAFSKGISEIAIENGIASWEDDATTLIGIGRGLKNANITNRLYAKYKDSIANSDSRKMQLIQKGFDMQ